jgi:membrane-associated phospholipid phosphatase
LEQFPLPKTMSDDAATLHPASSTGPVSAWRSQKGYWIFCTLGVSLFLLLAGAVAAVGMPYFSIEPEVSHALQSIPGSAFEWTMRFVSMPGDRSLWFGLLVATACFCLLTCRAWRSALVLFGIVLVGQGIKVGVKHLVARPRPTTEVVNVMTTVNEIHSFPSGHTVLYTVFFGFLWYLTFAKVTKRALRWPLLALLMLLLLMIGVSRIYLGAHWASDVLGGYLLGGAILIAGIGLHRAWDARVLARRASDS